MQEEKIYAKGLIFELLHLPQPDGRVFEVARRAPGVRLIIFNQSKGKMLLSKEFRRELGVWDYRLPGGKVFDTLEEFEQSRSKSEDILERAKSKAKEESIEEVGVELQDLSLVAKSTLGATVDWDLYIFESSEWSFAKGGAQPEVDEAEDIDEPIWVTLEEAKRMIIVGDIQEDRVAMILLRWIEQALAKRT